MKKTGLSFYAWLGLAATYVIVSFLTPITKSQLAKYHLSRLAIHWIDVSIIIPIVLILYLAYVAYENLNSYSQKIAANPDGKAFRYTALGLGVFAYGTLISALISTATRWAANSVPSFMANATRINNYAGLIVPLIAFILISEGAATLINLGGGTIKLKDFHTHLMLAAIAILGTSYAFIVFRHEPSVSALTGTKIFFMPDWLALITFVIPYVLAWSAGLLSVTRIFTFRQKTKGLVYKGTLNLLARGLGIVLLGYIALEYLTSLANRYQTDTIDWLLVIVYLLLILIGVGYMLIAIGSNRLKRIEEV